MDLSSELTVMFEERSHIGDLEQQIMADFENDYMEDIVIAHDMMANIHDIRNFLENVINEEPPIINEMSRSGLVNINRNNYINIM